MTDLAPLLGQLQATADPYPLYARLREAGPVVWVDPMQRWLVTGHHEAQALFTHSAASTDRRLASDAVTEDARPGGLPFVDPPEHTRLRSLVHQAFTARSVQALSRDVEKLAHELLDRISSGAGFDLIADYAGPLPAVILARMLGIPAEYEEQVRRWSLTIIETIDPVNHEIVSAEGGVARQEMSDFFADLVAQRRARRRDDLITRMIEAGEDGSRLTGEELLEMCLLLTVVGMETTTNLIGNGVDALLAAPAELARLRSDPGLIRSAVEELLRYDSPIQLAGRIALRDIEIGGRTLRRGQVAGIVIGAANRDPRIFADPERLDLGRSPNNHLAFGRGIHHCLGAPLARMQGPIALAAVLDRFPGLRAAGPAQRRHNVHVRGFVSYPVAPG